MSIINKNTFYVMTVVSIGIFTCNLDAGAVNVALPGLSKIFNVNTSIISRIALADLLAITSFVLVFGSLCDIKGVKKVFNWGFIITAVTSLFCGFSSNIETLIIFRFFHGIGEAMLLSTYGAIIVQYLPSDIRGRAFSFTSVIGGIALAIGSPLGGICITHFNWSYIFFINVPIGIIGFILTNKFLDNKNDDKIEPQSFDFIGGVFSFIGLFTLLYGLNMGEENNWLSVITIGCLILSVIFLILFVLWERKQKTPLLDLSIFKNPAFTFALIGDFVVLTTLEGTNFLLPFYFTFIHNLTADRIGLLMMIYPVLSTIISPAAGYLADKTGKVKAICVTSMIFIIISCLMFCNFGIKPNILFIFLSLILFGISVTFFFTGNTCFEIDQVKPKEEGIASAIISFNSNLASVIGICIFETIYSLKFSYDIPKTTHIPISNYMHIEGFHNACIFSTIICIIGLIAFIIAKEKRKAAVITKKRFSTIILKSLIIIFLLSFISSAGAAENGKVIYKKTIGFVKKTGIRTDKILYYSDGLKVKSMVFLPPSSMKKNNKIPIIIYSHDGVYGISEETIKMCKYMAAKTGYIITAPTYRGEDGSQGEIKVASGEVNDIINLMKALKVYKTADIKKIALFGTSHGALISVKVAAMDKYNQIKCIVPAYGVMDIVAWWKYLTRDGCSVNDDLSLKIYGNGPKDRPMAFLNRMGVTRAPLIKCPVLIIHGKLDDIVPVEQAYFLASALKKEGKFYELKIYHHSGHGFIVYAPYAKGEKIFSKKEKKEAKEALNYTMEFIKRYL